MSRLKVMLRGALISEIELKSDKEYIGGRKDGSDIRLQAEKGISREHFKLKYIDGRWSIQAVSRFGDIFSMGQKIEELLLDHGQSFQIPPYEFQLLDVPESEITNAGKAKKIENFNENEKTIIGAAPQVPYIKIVGANGDVREMLRLEVGEIWSAGRDPSCQIIIPDQRVSRRQFELHKVNGTYTIIDLASVNGTFLNGSPVSSTDPQSMKSGDVITVLDNTMYFELHDPNFKYKVEKIEIPPIAIEQPEEIEDYFEPQENSTQNLNAQQYPVDIPQIQQDQYDPQMNMGSGPFTGMPPGGGNPNQYYTFNNQDPLQTPLPVKKKITENIPLMAIFAILFLGGAYYVSELLNAPDPNLKVSKEAVDPNDPLAKLTPEQRSQVKEFYSLAVQMFDQGKYDLALEKFSKIHELVKEGYKDSREKESQADNALKSLEQQKQDEERLKVAAENLLKINEIAEKCRKLLTPTITVDKMSECLTPMAQIDASAPQNVQLLAEAEKIQKDRELKEALAKTKDEQIAELIELFKKAELMQNDGFAFKAIKLYKNVLSSNLPDPKKLKDKAKNRIEFIETKVAEKTAKSVSQADVLIQEGKLKEAVISLRESLIYDPDNRKVKEKIESYREEIRRQARTIYQEAIIDESYGIVDSTESKQGAKDKWKKITELDLDDGEYYKKALIKLRRYGIM